MERAALSEQERERQREGLTWALVDLEHLLERQVIGRHAYEALRHDYEARLQLLQAPTMPAEAPAAVMPRDPMRPPPAPRAAGRRPAEPAPADLTATVPPSPQQHQIPDVGAASAAAQLIPDGAESSASFPTPQPAGVTGLWINLLLFLGAFFVVIAALIFVATQWEQIGAGAKAGIMLGFTLGFIAGGLLCVRLPKVRPAGQTFLAIGAILLPLDILGGYTLLFRDQGISAATTWAWGSLICALFYGALGLSGLGRPYAAAMLAASISAWCGALAALDVPSAWLAAAFLPLPLLLLLAGRLAERTTFGRAVFGPMIAWAAQILVPLGCVLLLRPPFEQARAAGMVAAFGLAALFYLAAALSQPEPTLRAVHVAGAWGATALLAMAGGWWAEIHVRGYAAIVLGMAWLALAVAVGLRRAGQGWRNASNVSFVAGWAYIAALLVPWGFFVRDAPVYWTLIFGGALLYAALILWGFREPLTLYPLALAAALTLFHLLAIGPRPGPYGYAWAYTLASLVPVGLLQPLRQAGASRSWDRHLVINGQLVAIGAAIVARWVDNPFQVAGVMIIGALASALVAALERRHELLILPNLWALVATAAMVQLAGSGPRWAPSCYAGVGLALAIGLQAWRNTPAQRRDGWYVAHRLSAGGWALVGPILALINLAVPLADFLGSGELVGLVLNHAYGPAGLAIALCGAALAADAITTLRRPTGYSASAFIALATLMGIARITPDNPQAYAVPVGLYLLALSIYVAYERDLGPVRMPAANALLSSAVVVILGTTFLQSLLHPWRYIFLGLMEGLLLLGVTAFLRRRYGVALAVGFLTLTAFRAVFDVARALPNWVTIGLIGLVLLGLGVLVLLRRDRLEAWGSDTLRRWSQLT